jgi:sorbitol-6-phosphate 2-dehydrogenase
MNWLKLENKVVIVTGGASGIGKACCEEFAACGAKVVIADVTEESGKKVAAALPGDNLFVKTDVTSKASVDALIAAVIAKYGKLDVLVNNAGINIPRLLVDPAGKEELTEAVWDKVVAINMKGIFLCAQAAARVMIKQSGKGVIINMASESGSEGSEGQSVYAATKGATYNLTRSWAKELGKLGVRVVGVAPGILEATGLRSDEYERALAYTRGQTVEQMRANYSEKSIPLQRSGKLSEVANTVCFLASERGGYIHGTVVNVSGGKSRA